jgi:hypothetical protein
MSETREVLKREIKVLAFDQYGRRSGDHNICKQDSRTASATRHQINMVVVSPSKLLAALLPVKILDLGI